MHQSDHRLGFARGFERFVRLYEEGGFPIWGVTAGEFVVAQLERQLAELAGARFFLYLHLVYPHRPYDSPAPYDGMFGAGTLETTRRQRQRMINAYDGEICFTDAVVADLLAALGRHRRLGDSWIVVTSDHGEGFFEHGRAEHGNSLFDELLRVPLILRPPRGAGIAPRVIDEPVSLLDLHATVLDAAAGIRQAPAGSHGRSLLRFVDRASVVPAEDVVSQQPHSGDVHGAAIVRDAWKLIRREEDGAPLRLFDLATDPSESADLAGANAETVRRLERALLGAKGSVLIVLADAPLSAAQAQRPELERRMRGSRLHAFSAVVDLSNNTVMDMHVFDPAHQYAVFVAPSNLRLVVISASEEAVAGQLSTIRAGAFAGVPYEVAAAFRAGVQR